MEPFHELLPKDLPKGKHLDATLWGPEHQRISLGKIYIYAPNTETGDATFEFDSDVPEDIAMAAHSVSISSLTMYKIIPKQFFTSPEDRRLNFDFLA